MTRPFRMPQFVLLLAILGSHFVTAAKAAPTPEWMLKNGEKYFGEVVSYNFTTKQVGLRKADGKEHLFPANQLAFAGKWQLIWSPAFGAALKEYSPPLVPTLAWIFGTLLAFSLPVIIGLWGSAHVLGAVSSGPRHIIGVGKLLLLLILQATGWLVLSVVLDPDRPILPDKNADIVLLVTVMIVGLLVTSIVLSMHYQIHFMKGMAVTLLAGIFGGIVTTAMLLAGLFVATRLDTPVETLATKLVFEPFGWF